MFKKYNKCFWDDKNCSKKNFKKNKNQELVDNFYIKSIKSDLNLTNNKIKKLKVMKCNKCNIIFNNPWFTKEAANKIYSNIYGQHNRGWSNLLNFVNKGSPADHGSLFNLLKKKIKIRSYAEYNCPFTGIFLNFFLNEHQKNIKFYQSYSKSVIKYLTSRQLNKNTFKEKKTSNLQSNFLLKKKIDLNSKYRISSGVEKLLFVDNSELCWGQNCNFMSVNCKSYASEFFNLKILNLNNSERKIKVDLFGIFHTLDHTFNPNKILNFALNISKYVIVYCHNDEKLNKQHLFSLTENFLKYLNRRKIYSINLTENISKNYKSPELYFLCSKHKKHIKSFNDK
jgi:hypothetical protein